MIFVIMLIGRRSWMYITSYLETGNISSYIDALNMSSSGVTSTETIKFLAKMIFLLIQFILFLVSITIPLNFLANFYNKHLKGDSVNG